MNCIVWKLDGDHSVAFGVSEGWQTESNEMKSTFALQTGLYVHVLTDISVKT